MCRDRVHREERGGKRVVIVGRDGRKEIKCAREDKRGKRIETSRVRVCTVKGRGERHARVKRGKEGRGGRV